MWQRLLALVLAVTGVCHHLSVGAAEPDVQRQSAIDMAQRIDELLREDWKIHQISPAPLCSDGEFLRRASLDLNGVIPKVSHTRKFLADKSADKRRDAIDAMLSSPAYPNHLAATWRDILLPNGFDPQEAAGAVGLQDWMRRQFARNLRYDRIVGEFLTASGSSTNGPALFYSAQDLEPAKIADSTARIFLGLQIGCAECHDHPHDHWKQSDFWNYAAFFAGLNRGGMENQGAVRVEESDGVTLTIGDSDEQARPKFPGGEFAVIEEGGTARVQLAVWMSSRDNPYLSRAAVNWGWFHLFGRGLAHPVDDIRLDNVQRHKQLLDELADYFEREGFNIRQLLRTLAYTQAYQRSTQIAGDIAIPKESFAIRQVKSLTPEQLYDSLNRAVLRVAPVANQMQTGLGDAGRQQFLARLQTQARDPTEFQTGLPQALMLMNGQQIVQATDPTQSGLLQALAAPFFDNQQRLEILFLAALSRPPRDDEMKTMLSHLDEAEQNGTLSTATSDVLWALLNTTEFATNH